MRRAQAAMAEKILKARGVYKPYVSSEGERLYIESYPLTAMIVNGFDPEEGPTQNYLIRDCGLANEVITSGRVLLGQDMLGVVGQLLIDFHGPAYARRKAQEEAILASR